MLSVRTVAVSLIFKVLSSPTFAFTAASFKAVERDAFAPTSRPPAAPLALAKALRPPLAGSAWCAASVKSVASMRLRCPIVAETVGDMVAVRPLVYGVLAIQIELPRYDGEPLVYRVEPELEYDAFGRSLSAAVFGEEMMSSMVP